jgi:hypothetical protein
MAYFSPIALVFFPEYVSYAQIEPLRTTCNFQRIFDWPEMLLDGTDHLGQTIIEKVYHALQVKFRGQNVEKYVLGVAFVKF